MRKFRVLVHGTNFTVRRFILWRRSLGFYTTCWVEAGTENEAAERAFALLRDDPKLIISSITRPELQVEEITEISSFDERDTQRTGLVFYYT